MKDIKILITETSDSLNRFYIRKIKDYGYQNIFVAHDFETALKIITRENPDVVITNPSFSDEDPLKLLIHAKGLFPSSRTPIFLFNSPIASPDETSNDKSPTQTDTVINMLNRISLAEEKGYLPVDAIEAEISRRIREIGIPASVKGYHYLRQAIKIMLMSCSTDLLFTKDLYPAVAEHFNTTPSRVERAIRHAVNISWDHGDVMRLNYYFGYRIDDSSRKPTSAETIAILADHIRTDMKEARIKS